MSQFLPQEERLVEALRSAWDTLPGYIDIDKLPDGPDGGADALITLRLNDQNVYLVCKIKRQVFPRDVREISWQLHRAVSKLSRGNDASAYIPMIMADAISPGAKEDMRNDSTAYFEAGGSLFIPSKAAYLLVDRPPEKSQAKAMSTVFEGQRAMVLHAIWEKLAEDRTEAEETSEGWFSVIDIAKNSGASSGTVSETLTELERRDWVESFGSGPSKLRKLSRPGALLDEWTAYQQAQTPPKLETYYIPHAKPADILEALRSLSTSYEVTGEVAGQHYAPYLTKVSQCVVRVMKGLFFGGWLEGIKGKPVTEGWNLGLITKTPQHWTSFRQKTDGVFYASPLQTYLDLLQGPGRAKDLARHLREHYLRH